jgi:ribosomal protein L37AE/L43A
MTIFYKCKHCDTKLMIVDHGAAQVHKCPRCGYKNTEVDFSLVTIDGELQSDENHWAFK